MHQSSTDNLSQTATASTAQSGTVNSRPTTTTSPAPKSTSKWVINMSINPLTEPQVKLLAHGPNFAITPKSPLIGEHFAAVKQTCQGLAQGEAEELRAEVKTVLKKIQPPGQTSLGKSKKH